MVQTKKLPTLVLICTFSDRYKDYTEVGAVGSLVGLLVAHHVRDSDPEVGVGAVVGVLQGVGVGMAGPRALPPTQLKAAQQLPPSGLLHRHLLSEQRKLQQN